jgi:hypothetical protein
MLIFMAKDTETVLAFAAGAGESSLADAAPEHGRRQLAARGCSWGYLDVGAMLASLEIDVDDKMAELPPALAQRLRSLRAAGHMDMPGDGISEVVIEMGQP